MTIVGVSAATVVSSQLGARTVSRPCQSEGDVGVMSPHRHPARRAAHNAIGREPRSQSPFSNATSPDRRWCARCRGPCQARTAPVNHAPYPPPIRVSRVSPNGGLWMQSRRSGRVHACRVLGDLYRKAVRWVTYGSRSRFLALAVDAKHQVRGLFCPGRHWH
jgi:hypothetical protein